MNIFVLDKYGNTLCSMSSNSNDRKAMNFLNDRWTRTRGLPETFEFECPLFHPNVEHLVELNQIIFQYEDEYHLFTISEVEMTHGSTSTIRCYCESVTIDLLNTVVLPNTHYSISAERALEIILGETSWAVGNVDYFIAQDVEFSSFKTALSEIQDLSGLYGGGYPVFRIDYKNGRVLGKYVDFVEKVGVKNGIRFEYGRNAEQVIKKVDTSNVVTAVIPIGNDELDISDIDCTVSTHGFDKPFGRYYVELDENERSELSGSAYHIFGTIDVETDDVNELAKKGWEHLQENKIPKIEYEFNPKLLGNQKVNVGDTVYAIDRELNNLQLSAEVDEIVISFTDETQNSIRLANYEEVESKISDEVYKIQQTLKNATLDNPMLKVGETNPYDGNFDLQNGVLWVDTSQASSGVIVLKEYQDGVWSETISKDVVQNLVDEKTEGIEGTLQNYVDDKIAGVSLTIPAGSTATENPNVGGLWMDTSKEPYILRRWNGTTWEAVGMDEETVSNLVDAYAGGLQGELDAVKVDVQQLEDSVSSKVSQATYDEDKANNEIKFEQQQAAITQTSNLINSKVDQTTYTADKNGMQSQIDKNTSDISQNASNISLKVESSTFNTTIQGINNNMAVINQNIEKNTAQIDINKDSIESKVSKDGVISSINQSAESVTIDADKINFNGVVSQNSGGYSVTISDGAVTSTNNGNTQYSVFANGYLDMRKSNGTHSIHNPTELSFFNNDTTKYGQILFSEDSGMLDVFSSHELRLRSNVIDFENSPIENFKTPLSVEVTGTGNAVNGASYDIETQMLTLTKGVTFVTKANGMINHPLTLSGSETGYVGIGGQTTVTTNASQVAGYYCQFKYKRSAVPASVTLTSTSSAGTNKAFTDLTIHGFWFYITNTSGTTGYKYWRGTYTTT